MNRKMNNLLKISQAMGCYHNALKTSQLIVAQAWGDVAYRTLYDNYGK